ncbi:hypothetical protein F4808DRAFT_421150 [Astrocystis sublimbata]|nr:hypothetical protein F4808DRAFT_421150 [Astrocystis sublimbata]
MRILTSAFILLVTIVTCFSTYSHDANIEHFHDTLTLFLSKGQLSLELLPPLSLLIARLLSPLYLTAAGIIAKSLTILLQLHRICANEKSLDGRLCMLLVSFALSYISSSVRNVHWTALHSCSSISDLILTVVSFRFTEDILSIESARWARGIDVMMAIAWVLGCNLGDVVTIFSVILFQRVARVVVKSDKHHTDFEVIGQICKVILASILTPTVALAVAYGLLFPMSEVQAGGNYNLHFLSPQARRMLSPIIQNTDAPIFSNHTVASWAVIPYLPVSLYIPMAGFLWLDGAIWREDLGVWSSESELEDSSESSLGRVFFSDPISTRHPWAFEQVMDSELALDPRQQDYIKSHLWPGEGVFLRSRVTGHYVGVSPGQRSLIDQEMNIAVGADGFSRTLVSGQYERSENTTWVIEYDSQADTGFRLLNPAHGCYLASSFRTYPDWDGERSLDLVSNQMNMVIETVCTRMASKAASTFFIIEGKL